jgi:hypothetical protein
VAVAAASDPSAAGALSARGAPRPVRRRSEASGKGGPRLGGGVIDPDGVGPPADRGRLHRGRLWAPSLFGRPTWGDCRQCPQTAVVQRAGVSESRPASVANRSVTCPTRLETRTKESNMCASRWARTKPGGAMKVKALLSVGSGRIRASATARGALPARLDRSVGEAALERTRWDPKDGELCPSRTKPEETLVEVRSDSDVQIDRQTWV